MKNKRKIINFNSPQLIEWLRYRTERTQLKFQAIYFIIPRPQFYRNLQYVNFVSLSTLDIINQ